MNGTVVMVRSDRDEPVVLVAIAAGRVVVEVVDRNPEKRASIGFPRSRVFVRDVRLLRKLRASFKQGRPDVLSSLWARAIAPDLSGLPLLDAAT
jgi:hypothetical protein